jgi:hypothetical protein
VLYGGLVSLSYDANYKEVRMSLDDGGDKKSPRQKKRQKRKIENAKTH